MTTFLFSWNFGDTSNKYINPTTCYKLQRMATYLVECARKHLLDSIPYRGPSLRSLPARIAILTVGLPNFENEFGPPTLHSNPNR